ncbi:neuropeptides capa receptor-like [Asterias amurensis]|uniref:neuropeptides capa receptor-like n=1 Tax=Asterias amurensis TaxID=7602 RepID=UPI003AB44060
MESNYCRVAYYIKEEDVSAWIYPPADDIIITIILPILMGLGIISNSTFLLIIFRIPKMRSDTNIILAHLAISDLLFLATSVLLYMWSYYTSIVIYNQPYKSSAGCVIHAGMTNTGYFAAILLVTLVSFERYLAMCHPMKHLKIRGRKRTNRLVAICWVVGIVISALTVPLWADYQTDMCLRWPENDTYQGFPSTMSFCSPLAPWIIHVVIPLLNLPWTILMVANVFMFVGIVRALHNRVGANVVEDDQKAQQVRNQVAKMLVVNGIIFFICHIPYRVFSFSWWICYVAQIPNPLDLVFGNTLQKWLVALPQLINTCINPLIYGAMNSQYRLAFKQVFLCKAKQRPKSVSTMSRTEMTGV